MKKPLSVPENTEFGFEMAALVFLDDERLIAVDDRFDYGEERMITMGHIENRLHVVAYTETEDTVRIICV